MNELIETVALVHLKRYEGKVAVLNHDGFYEPLKQLLDHYLETKMMPLSTREKVIFADSVEELLDRLED